MKDNVSVIARFAAMFVVIINMILTYCEKNPLPCSEDEVYMIVSVIATFVGGVYMFWKNNSLTGAAKTGDMVMNAIKQGIIEAKAVEEFIQRKSDDTNDNN